MVEESEATPSERSKIDVRGISADDFDGEEIKRDNKGTTMSSIFYCIYSFFKDAFLMSGFAFAFLVLCSLILALVAIIFVLTILLRGVNFVCLKRQEDISLNQHSCNYFEDRWIENVENSFPKSTRSEWITLGGDIKTHYLAIPCEVSPNSRSLDDDKTAKDDDISTSMVMIHGTGSAASLAWSSSAESLSRQYSLYAPDLPGFGRSTFSWDTFQNSSLEELEDLYATWLANYIDAMKLSKPIVVGHSIGGFFATKFAKKFPTKLSKLILVDPAGIYPTLGSSGYYFGWLFKMGIPTRQLRFLGHGASMAFYTFFDYKRFGAKPYFWLQLNASPTAFGDHVVSKFITISPNGLSSYWNRPAILDLLTSNVPLAFVYGEADNLMPPEQGRIVEELMQCDEEKNEQLVYLVPEAWHMPFHINGGAPFVEKVLLALKAASKPKPSDMTLSRVKAIVPARHRSSWSIKATSDTIEQFYDLLRGR